MKTLKSYTSIILILLLISGCTPGIMKCFLKFDKYQSNHKFNYSKEQLKNNIVELYSYDENLLLKNFGKTLVENEAVNEKYRTSTTNWLDKNKWAELKEQIRNETTDTLRIIISKHHGLKTVSFKAIVSGNINKSELTITGVEYQRTKACVKETNFYLERIQDKIVKNFIEKLK